jgi:hypothetical protein
MSDMILDASILPEPLFKLVTTDKIRVRETDGIITMLPVREKTDIIDELCGCLAGTGLTVDKFLEWRREGEDRES